MHIYKEKGIRRLFRSLIRGKGAKSPLQAGDSTKKRLSDKKSREKLKIIHFRTSLIEVKQTPEALPKNLAPGQSKSYCGQPLPADDRA